MRLAPLRHKGLARTFPSQLRKGNVPESLVKYRYGSGLQIRCICRQFGTRLAQVDPGALPCIGASPPS